MAEDVGGVGEEAVAGVAGEEDDNTHYSQLGQLYYKKRKPGSCVISCLALAEK